MKLNHVGIRPEHKVVISNDRKGLKDIRGLSYEILPDDSYRVWTDRMLTSGCNKEVSGDETLGDLIFCPKCDEFFSRDQFKEDE